MSCHLRPMDALTRRAERARSKFSSKSSKVTKLGDSPKSSKFLKYRCCQAAPFPKIILRSAELPNPQNFLKIAVLKILGVHYSQTRALRKQDLGDGSPFLSVSSAAARRGSPFLSSGWGHFKSKSHECQTDFGRGWICDDLKT